MASETKVEFTSVTFWHFFQMKTENEHEMNKADIFLGLQIILGHSFSICVEMLTHKLPIQSTPINSLPVLVQSSTN